PEAGFRIAQTVPELSGVADCILSHHERWDGKGYPNGLSGKEIPLLARILTVADAYDAMTQNRPYRKALSHEKARDELKKNSGTQFDPQIVAIFLEYLEQVEPDI
ncbi:MAG TPA: HD domain-containing phosphohydrolase, partial [Clostridia bacterium]|nr:HD domain-containing phosphohydrolase [Clostridia bacterium]